MKEEEEKADPIENQKEKCFVILPVLEIQFGSLRFAADSRSARLAR